MNTESQPCPFSIAVHTYDALLGEFTSVATGCGLNMLGSVRFFCNAQHAESALSAEPRVVFHDDEEEES